MCLRDSNLKLAIRRKLGWTMVRLYVRYAPGICICVHMEMVVDSRLLEGALVVFLLLLYRALTIVSAALRRGTDSLYSSHVNEFLLRLMLFFGILCMPINHSPA